MCNGISVDPEIISAKQYNNTLTTVIALYDRGTVVKSEKERVRYALTL
jgi:hypothetical protein